MQIDPKVSFYFGVWTSILLMVASAGTNFFDGALPALWVPFIVKWCAILGAINSTILTAASGYSSTKAGPLVSAPPPAVPTVVKVLIAAFALSLFLASGSAQAQGKPPLTGDIVKDIEAAKQRRAAIASPTLTGDVGVDLVKALDAKLLPDLQYALKLAQATNSTVTAPCWQAWIDMINTQETAVKDTQGNDIPMPDPHVITVFERLVELRNALQPESKFMISCSPVASMAKLDIAKFMGVVISGGAGIAALVPGL